MNKKAARNILIVLAIAAVIVFVPQGGTAANVVGQVLSLIFLASFAWFASLMYRQHRVSLYSLGDRHRGILYVAAGVVALTLSATNRLWATSGGSVAWLLLIGASAWATIAIVLAARR